MYNVTYTVHKITYVSFRTCSKCASILPFTLSLNFLLFFVILLSKTNFCCLFIYLLVDRITKIMNTTGRPSCQGKSTFRNCNCLSIPCHKHVTIKNKNAHVIIRTTKVYLINVVQIPIKMLF